MHPSTTQALVVVDEWTRSGVTDVVACPGSRNAPLLLALHAADRAGRLRLHVRIDERSAGFLALGLAWRSGRVTVVVVTSGTAVANLHPAVLEASHAGIGLLVASADRPLEQVGTGANQTIDQVGLFGGAVRASLALPLAEDRTGAAAGWRAAVARALDRAGGRTTGDPGPVQLDVPMREPLVEPDLHVDRPDPDPLGALDGRPDGAPWTRVAARGLGGAGGLGGADGLAPRAGARTLVIAGHGGDARAARLPAGVPVLAEPSSSLWGDAAGGRSLGAGAWILAEVLAGALPALMPEQVVVLGRPTLHRSVSRLLADPRVTVLAVPASSPTGGGARPGWTDVLGTVTAVGEVPDPGDWTPDPAFARAWAAADDAVAPALAAPRDPISGPALAAAVVAALPAGALLVVGSSNPVRDVGLAAVPRADVDVRSARGVSGIDGAVSMATGAALAHDGPGYALIGDLTFLHDSGGLLVGPGEPTAELTIVVANDDGGGIFTELEQGAPPHAESFERVFGTPHGTDLSALCAAHGVAHRRVTDLDALPAVLAPTGTPEVRVVEVPVDRDGRREATARTVAKVRDALRCVVPDELTS